MPKRGRGEDLAWTVIIPKASLLTNMVQAVANLTQTICVNLADGWMSTQAVSSAKSCMVTARLRCVVEWAGGNPPMPLSDPEPGDDSAPATLHSFCLDARTLLNALRTVHETQTLHIRRPVDDDAPVVVAAWDEVTSACSLTWKLPVLVEDSFSVTLDTLDYSGEWLYDVATLKTDIKRCRAMECDDIVTLRMSRTTGVGGDAPIDEATENAGVEKTVTLTEMAAEGSRGTVVVRHNSTTTGDDMSAEAPADDLVESGGASGGAVGDSPGAPSELVMEQAYCVENLCDFLKAVDHSSIKLLLATAKPLVAEVSLGGDDSQMCFVQGPYVGAG